MRDGRTTLGQVFLLLLRVVCLCHTPIQGKRAPSWRCTGRYKACQPVQRKDGCGITVVEGRENFDRVESDPFGLPGLQDSPKGDPGTWWQPRAKGGRVHEDERSPWDNRGGLLFGQQPCLPGGVTDGAACGIGLALRSTDERKRGWAYLERMVGMVGWPGLSYPSLGGCAATHEEEDLLAEDGEDLDLVRGVVGVLRSPCVSNPSMGDSLEIA